MAITTLDEETSKKVKRQVEFYFSDSNLPRDRFLIKTVDESEDGMVSLALICSFTRMRGHLGLGELKPDEISEDTVNAVAETLRKSDFLKISDDAKKVGRITQLAKPEEVIEQLDSRTIAASPLPYDVKLEDVQAFFTKLAEVNSVRLPHHVRSKKVFCGTALVEFSTEEDAKKILEQTLAYAGADLELKPKKDFDAEREKQQENANFHPVPDDTTAEETNYPKGLIVAFTLKSITSESKQNGSEHPVKDKVDASKTDGEEAGNEEGAAKLLESENKDEVEKDVSDDKEMDDSELNCESKQEEAQDDEKSPGGVDEKKKEKTASEEKDDEKSPEDVDEKKKEKTASEEKGDEKSRGDVDEKNKEKTAFEERRGAASFKDDKDVVLREDLKAVFEKFGNVQFVDFKMGDASGFIRFEVPEAAQKARAFAVLSDEGGLIVKNYIATLEPVSGEAERDYWKFRDNFFKGNRGRGKHFRGGRHGWSRNGRPNKFQKVRA